MTGASPPGGLLPVIVVGAGPTGLVAASLLAEYRVPVVVLERWADPYPQPRAVHLDDEVLRILGWLGLADEFAEISRPARGLRLLDGSMSVLTEFARRPGAGRHGYPGASMFDQPELEQLLRDSMPQRPGVTLSTDTEVDLVVHEHDCVRVHTTDRTTGERHIRRAQYVLGCDGANSAVRQAVGIRWHDRAFTQRWLVVDIETDADLGQWDGVLQVCDSRRAATFMRIGPARYRWEFQLLDDEAESDYAGLDALEPLLRPWLGTTGTDRLQLIRSAQYTFRARIAERWRDRRVFLLGDAAHLTPPFIGQGMGSGIRDAANLAWKLAGVLGGTLPESALDSYEQERKPHASALIRLAASVGHIMTGGGTAGDRCRRLVAPGLTWIPGIAQLAVDSATPPLTGSSFVRHRGRRRPLRGVTGALCPNAVVDRRGRRYDEVVPFGFSVVTVDPLRPAQRQEIARRGATAVQVAESSTLGRWLAGGQARAAVVRPDRTVMAVGRSVADVYTHVPAMPLLCPQDEFVSSGTEPR